MFKVTEKAATMIKGILEKQKAPASIRIFQQAG